MALAVDELSIIHYPDPRLRKKAAKVATFDGQLEAIARRMLELMRGEKGVGLAAPQVGLSLRMFVMNATGKEGDDAIYVNPELHDLASQKDGEEGCLSIPLVRVHVRRASRCRLVTQDLKGKLIELPGEDFVARVWQHENDHLNGVLIVDRMGPADKIVTRTRLREMESEFKAAGAKSAQR